MKMLLAILTVALLNAGAHAEELNVTFGADSDLAAKYGEHDLTGNAKQNADIAAPNISIGGLDLDGLGANDDKIEVKFAVTATGGDVARLAQGYRLDAGYTLRFEIVSVDMVLGTGKTSALNGNFVSATGNNRGAALSSENKGQSLVLKSTASGNNRARSIVAEFDVPVDASQLAAPIIVPVADKPAPGRSDSGRAARKPGATTTMPAKPPKAVAPPKIETDSLLLPRLFCDNMVLQQQTKNTFWGWAEPSETIAVKASWGAEASARADADGKWKLFLETPQHGTGHSLIISGEKDTINIKNVAIGEVWLCAGQSNMGWSMGNSFEAETMKNSVRPLSPPIITKSANLGHQYPGHQFNAMIHPVRPYGIRGMIWYQGERNSKDVPQAANYRKQLALLIHYFRSSWHELSGDSVADDLPFQFTQLPSWTAEQTKPVEGLEAPAV